MVNTIIIVAALAATRPHHVTPDALERSVLDSVRQVESGGHPNPERAVGDSGKAIGPYQIWHAYWADALEYDPSIGGTYADCRNAAYAERVILAYWHRYAPPSPSAEQLARIHNGGPKGWKSKATLKYWLRVQANMR